MTNDPLTVLTANLFNDHSDTRELERVIQRTRPDVLATQELGPRAARVLEKHYDHGLLRPQTDYNGMGLAATFGVVAEEMDTPNPRAITAIMSPSSSDRSTDALRFMSVRLPPPFFGEWVGPRRIYAKDLVEHVKDHSGPLCLLGDLNSTPVWPAYRMLTRELQDGAGQVRRLIPPRGATWPIVLPLLRIDHVLVRGFSVIRTETLSIKGSDHKGVLAEVEVLSNDTATTRPAAR